MSPGHRQRIRAAAWGLLESLRESAAARLLLGALALATALVRWRRGDPYRALDAATRVVRVARIGWLARLAGRLEASILAATCLDSDGAPRSARANALVDAFRHGAAQASFRGGLDSWEKLVRLGGELMILKEPDAGTGELGVLILKYTPGFGRFAALYDLPRVLQRYQIVLEPSWIGYRDPIFQLFYARERRVVVQAQHRADFETIARMGANLVPVPFGAGHWVDPDHFHPLPGIERDYLATFVANWSPHKRHHLLLDALRRLPDRSARVALIGYPWKGYTRERIEHEVRRRGLADRVDVYQRVSRKELNRLFNRAHANLLLSRKEGASKVYYEGLAAGTPALVIADHEGVAESDVNDRTGIRATAAQLPAALEMLRAEGRTLDPHGWWRENASIPVTTERLEGVLRECARTEGRPWTRGLHHKKNDPNLCYCDASLAERLRPAYAALAELLRSDAEIRRYRVRYERPACAR